MNVARIWQDFVHVSIKFQLHPLPALPRKCEEILGFATVKRINMQKILYS